MAVTVQFGTDDATAVTVVSDTELTATTPAGTGAVDVTVTTAGGSDTLTDGYTYQPSGPQITSVTPTTIYMGANTVQNYTGTDLPTGTFDGRAVYTGDDSGASPVSQYLLSITSATTAGAAADWQLGVGGDDGETVTAVFTFAGDPGGTLQVTLEALDVPTIDSITASVGPGGTVTVTGSGFVENVNWALARGAVGASVPSRVSPATWVDENTLTVGISSSNPPAPGDYDYWVIAAASSALADYVNTPAGTVTITAA